MAQVRSQDSSYALCDARMVRHYVCITAGINFVDNTICLDRFSVPLSPLSQNWIVYHANDSVTGACDDGRTTRVQSFTWNEDGTPNFGEPIAPDTVIRAPSGDTGIDPLPQFNELILSHFRSMIYDTGYLRHSDVVARVDIDPSPSSDSQFC